MSFDVKYVIAIDSSSSACKTSLIDLNGVFHKTISIPLTLFSPDKDLLEYDPQEIWDKHRDSLEEILKDIDISKVVGIGITNQRETTVIWSKKSGKPLFKAVSWQDRRNKEFIDKYRKYEDLIKSKTGLSVDLYFSASKIIWLLENIVHPIEDIRAGTIDTWIIANLTEHREFLTDVTNASRTLLFNIDQLCWDQELLDLFNIPKSILPEIKASGDFFGYWNFKGHKIPILGVIGDQQASLLSAGFKKGSTICTYGTGLFVMSNSGEIRENTPLLTTIAWKIREEPQVYAIEAGSFVCGNFLKKLENSRRIDTYEILDISFVEGIYLEIPAGKLFNFGSDYLEKIEINVDGSSLRGELLLKSAFNGIALVTNEILLRIREKIELKELLVTGLPARNQYLNKVQAEISNITVVRSFCDNRTILGVFYLVIASGNLLTKEELNNIIEIKDSFRYSPCFENVSTIEKLVVSWGKNNSNL